MGAEAAEGRSMNGRLFGRVPPSIFPRPEKPPRPEPQTGKGKPRPRIVVPPNCSTRQALRIVARTPRVWSRFLVFLVRFGCCKVHFYCACWSRGYRVSTIRRLAREAQ